MARKRINTKFAVILVAVVGVTGVAVFGGYKLLRPKQSPAKFEQLTNAAVEAKDWRNAFVNYSKFVAISPKSAENYVKLGDFARLAAATNRELMMQDRAAWEKALEVDPRYVPALRKLLDLEWEIARVQPSPAILNRVRQLAENVVTADPNDKRAIALIPTATVQGWLRNVETDATRLETDMASMKAIVEANPGDSDTASVLGTALIRKGTEAARAQRGKEALAAFKDASDLFENAIEKEPENLLLQFRAVGLYRELRRADSPNAKTYDEKMASAIRRSKEIAKPDQPLYVDVNIEAAQLALDRNEREAAGAIFKDLMDRYSDNQVVRLRYADYLQRDPATRMQAIEILSRPISTQVVIDTSTALGAERRRQLEFATRLTLQGYRLDAAAVTKDEAEKSGLLASVKSDVAQLAQELPDAPQPLILRGRVEMVEGRQVDAVRTLGQAKTLMERRPERSGDYYELLMRLADAYTQTRQTGPAKDVLRQITSDPATRTYIPARFQLIRLLAMEGNQEEVVREFNEADKLVKSGFATGGGSKEQMEAAIKALSIGIILSANPEESVANLKEMPETNKAQRVQKGSMAAGIGQFDEAARVLGDAYAEDSKDSRVAQLLVQSLVRSGKTDQAKSVLAQARANLPDDVGLKLLSVQLEKGSKEDMKKVFEDQIAGNPDEFGREMMRYELSMAENDRPKALESLDKAMKLKPNDKRVLDQMFQNYLVDRKLDEAEKLLPKLTEINGDQAGGNLYRFRLTSARGQTQEGLAIARRLTQDLPQFGQSWLTLGQAFMAIDDPAQALAGFQQALQRQPNNVEALRGSIEANYRLNQPAEALRVLNDAIARYPNDPGFRDYKINYELLYGDSDRAIQLREQQAAGQEGDFTVQAQLGNDYMKVSAARQKRGDLPGAREMARKASVCFGRVLEAKPEDLNVVTAVARSALSSDQPLSVEAALRKSADSPGLSGSAPVMLILSEYYLATGRGEEAEKAVREAVRRGGAAAGPRRAAALTLSRLGKVDDAISMLDGIENAKSDQALQRQRAEILIGSARFEEAEKAVRSMLVQRPDDAELQNLLTIVFVNSKRVDDAQKQIAATLARDARNMTALYYRALLQLQTNGDMTSAVRDLQVIRDFGNFTPEMRMILVEALRRSGQPDAAARELRESVKMDPNNVQARLQLADFLTNQSVPRLDDALKLVEEGLTLPQLSGNPDLLLSRGRILALKGDTKGALESAKFAVVNSKSAIGAVRQYLGAMLAAKEYKLILTETEPVIQSAEIKPYWIHVSRGAAYKGLGDRDAAINEFTTAIETAGKANDDDGAGATISMMASQMGIDDAIKAIAPRVESGVKYRLVTALLQQKKGELVTALATLEPALAELEKLTPAEQAQVCRFAGLLLVSPGAQQNYDRASDLYRKVLKITPDDITILNNISYLISERVGSPDFNEALGYSTRAVELLRKSGTVEPLVFDTHGWLLVLNGRVAEGINILNEALSRKSFMEGHYHLGVAYLRAGFPRDGLEQLKKAAKLSDVAENQKENTYAPRIKLSLKEAEDAVAAQLQSGAGGGGGGAAPAPQGGTPPGGGTGGATPSPR